MDNNNIQQGPEITFTRWGHQFESGHTKEGYAQCTQCGCVENSPDMVRLCQDSVIMEDLIRRVEAAVKVLEEIKK